MLREMFEGVRRYLLGEGRQHEEAGGFFGNEHGQPPGPVEFTTGYLVLAAGNQDLARQLARVLSE